MWAIKLENRPTVPTLSLNVMPNASSQIPFIGIGLTRALNSKGEGSIDIVIILTLSCADQRHRYERAHCLNLLI